MEPQAEAIVAGDEAALDKELAESIASVQAGKVLAPEAPAGTTGPAEPVVPVTPEAKPEIPPAKPQEESASTTPNAEVKEEAYEFRIPNKGKFESDESYEKRVELLDLVKRRKLATTPEAKQALSAEIQTAKGQLRNLNGSDKINNPNPAAPVVPVEEDEATKADKERLKQLGGATKEDIQEILQQDRIATETKNTLERFVERHPELKNDADVREVFFDFVDANYNWTGKTGKELMTVLELARESMFKPSETIQERVLKGANVAEKVNAMQFPGGTLQKATYSPEMKESIDELVATGMTEDKALELLSE